jgi:hypothetical protein
VSFKSLKVKSGTDCMFMVGICQVPQLFERTRVSEPAAFEASEEKTPAAASNSMVVTVSFENPHLLAPSHGPPRSGSCYGLRRSTKRLLPRI